MLFVLAVHTKDIHLMELNLDLFSVMGQSAPRHECLVSAERGVATDQIQKKAARSFSKVHVHEYEPYSGQPEWPRAQNYAWQNAARIVPSFSKSHWLWWEPDVTPLRPEWTDKLDSAYREAGKPFMGHVVPGMGHLNGVAVYPNQVAVYNQEAMMVRSTAFDLKLSRDCKDQIQPANHLMAHHPRVNGVTLSVKDTGAVSALLSGGWVTFHGVNDGSLARILMERYR